jgi:hypothetical protein
MRNHESIRRTQTAPPELTLALTLPTRTPSMVVLRTGLFIVVVVVVIDRVAACGCAEPSRAEIDRSELRQQE